MIIWLFTNADAGCAIRDQVQNFGRDQAVINHDVGALQKAMGLHGQQFRVPRSRANEKYFACF
jgi:hypothetical protein